MLENEEWCIIEEFPQYLVSNLGRIKHQDRIEARRVAINDRGFPIIQLKKLGNPTRYLRHVNKLVALAFVPKPAFQDDLYPDDYVWHIDGDFTNCQASNLRWDSRPRVLEWNNMHRRGRPSFYTPPVKNNRTGKIYENAFECAMDEGELESKIVWWVERQARHTEDDNARYRYISER